MMTLDQWTPFLYKAQDRSFYDKRDNAEVVFPEYSKPGPTKKPDYRSVTAIGIGPAGYTAQGGQAHLDEYTVGTERVTKYKKFTIAIIRPEELEEDIYNGGRVDEDKVRLFKEMTNDLTDSLDWAHELVAIDVHIRGASTTVTNTWPGTFRDGLALFSTSHVTTKGVPVTWSNLQTAAPLNALTLMEGVTMMENVPSENGRPGKAIKRIGIMCGRYWEWRLPELLEAKGQPDTANVNTPNALTKRKHKVEWVPIINEYIPATDTGWDLIDLDNHKYMHFMKMKATLNRDVEPRTGNKIERARSRFAVDADSSKGWLHNNGV